MRFLSFFKSRQTVWSCFCLGSALGLLLAGCGGGGGSNGGPQSPTPTPTGTPGATPTPTSPVQNVPNFVFASTREGTSQIYLAQNNAQLQTRLTEGLGVNSHPSLSPDGRSVVFSSTRDGNPEIYLLALDGPEPRLHRYTMDSGAFAPSDDFPIFSPDGSTIAWLSTRSAGLAQSNIWLMNATGDNQRQLTTVGGVSSLTWAPSGSRLAFVTTTGSGSTLRSVDVGSKVVSSPLVTRTDNISSPSYNSAGTKIVFGVAPRAVADASLAILDVASGVVTSNFGPAKATHPSWSRNSDLILYDVSAGAGRQVFVITANGSATRQLTTAFDSYQASFQ